MSQATQTILMVRPVNFRMNEQTAVNNYYQKNSTHLKPEEVTIKAQQEFDHFVEKLKTAGVNVIVIEDSKEPNTPDSIFPNNWVSFHENGDVVIYPMFAENRRLERREDVLDLLESHGFEINNLLDYTSAEEEAIFLEGTGSIVLDRENKKAYCALSPRAHEDIFIEYCEDLDLAPIIFHAYQTVNEERKLIYHTNVMMCIADRYAVICLDCIDDKTEQKFVLSSLKENGKEIIKISEDQVNLFAGNMLQVLGKNNQPFLVMSSSAYHALTTQQKDKLESFNPIIHAPLEVIETFGGGSARCMMVEVFLPKVS